MKLALVQMNIAWQDRKKNLERALSFIQRAQESGCDVIVFPEMFTTGFSMDISYLDDGSETESMLSDLARRNCLFIIAGYPLRVSGEEKAINIARVYDRSGKTVAQYAKIHPFSYMNENKFFSAGRETVIFEIDKIPSSIFICYDLRFPEIFRKVARAVYLIFVIANWPTSRLEHWKILLRARAIENQCFIIGVNRTGRDGNGIIYPGSSIVCDPSGNIILIGDEREEFLTVEIDPPEVQRIRNEFPFLIDMRLL